MLPTLEYAVNIAADLNDITTLRLILEAGYSRKVDAHDVKLAIYNALTPQQRTLEPNNRRTLPTTAIDAAVALLNPIESDRTGASRWLMAQRRKEEIVAFLNKLGDTPDAVANTLRDLHVTGTPGTCASCPIAIVLNTFLGCWGVQAYCGQIIADGVVVNPPYAIRQFIGAVDAGEYQDLIDVDDIAQVFTRPSRG